MMKKLLFATLAILMVCQSALASDTEEVFLSAQGKLILPHLNLDGKVYYVVLTRVGTTGYNFTLSIPSITDITPATGGANPVVWATAGQLVGTWKPVGEPITLSLTADGNFTLDTPADNSDPKNICPAGRETGTYRYDSTTGIFMPTVKTDTDGDCGFSDPGGPIRFKVINGSLTLINVEDGAVTNHTLVAQ